MKSAFIYSTTILAILFGAYVRNICGQAATGPTSVPATATTEPWNKIIVSKETTYFTGPLFPDGTVNYVAALNEKYSKGVTPENNAAIPILAIFDSAPWKSYEKKIAERVRKSAMKELGIEKLPDLPKYVSGHEFKFADEDMNKAMSQPWRGDDLPEVKKWVDANEKSLAAVTEACKRPRFFVPIVSAMERPQMMDIVIPILSGYRDAARCLSARAMMHLAKGDTDKAIDDLLTIHKFARLTSNDCTLIGQLVAIACDSIATRSDKDLIASGKLTAAQARGISAELAKLPPIGNVVETIDSGERSFSLDFYSMMSTKSVSEISRYLAALRSVGGASEVLGGQGDGHRLPLDWNLILRRHNEAFDKQIAAMRKPMFAGRQEALAAFDKEMTECVAKSNRLDNPLSAFEYIVSLTLMGNQSEKCSEAFSDMMIGMLMPTLGRAVQIEDEARMSAQLAVLGYSLAAYRADKGKYPDKLADLAPAYIKTIPKDSFTDKDLAYKKAGKGFVLYSLGPNMKDDGGIEGYGDHGDIVLHVE